MQNSGRLKRALARFEMGCERPSAAQALTDYLLALRVLLEPEGPASGRLAQRLAIICARPDDRVGLTERTARFADHIAPILNRAPSRRANTPAEVARAVAFLAGDDAASIHGATLSVDGGLSVV